MNSKTQVPKYAHLEYQLLHVFEISISEYFLLDMIFRLSGNGRWWCNKTLENIAFDMRITKRGVQKLRDRLIEKELLVKGVGNRLRTSEKWNKVHFLDEAELKSGTKFTQKWNKVHPKVEQSSSKTSVENNYRITKNNVSSKNPGNGTGYQHAKRIADMLKLKAINRG